ncbi:ROK family protein [Salana multivorans]
MARTRLPKGGAATLQELCRHGELTRRELQGLLEVSGPTVTRVVAHLDELGLLEAEVVGDGALGRPAATIRLSESGLAAIVVSLTAPGTVVALASMSGTVTESLSVDVTAEVPYEAAVERISEAVTTLLGRARGRFRALAGVGISFGGAASFGEGRLTMPSGFPQWHGRALAADIQQLVGLPTFIDNQPVGYIRALRWFDPQGLEDRYLCFADYGIAGCSSAGMPRPDRGVSTGGFGHLGGRVSGTEQCWCGLYDCLNTRASLRALRAWGARRDLVTPDAHIPEIVSALEADPEGREALEAAAGELVTATLDACRVLGLPGYLLGGALFDTSAVAREAATKAVEVNRRIATGSFLPTGWSNRGPFLSASAIVADGMALSGRIETLNPRV